MSTKKSEKSKKGTRDSRNPESEQTDSQNDTISEVIPEKPQEIRTIVISVESYRNIVPIYPVSDIRARLKYLDRELGETQEIPVTDDENLILTESVEMSIDVNSVKQVDLLASNPIFLTTVQSSGSLDLSLYENIKISQNAIKPPEDVQSLFSMYEAFTGERSGVKITDMKGAKKKGKKEKSEKEPDDKSKSKPISEVGRGSKISKKSRGSRGSIETGKSGRGSQIDVPIVKSEVYGMCVIDLIPLFYGKSSFTEKLLLQPIKRSCQILSTVKNFPEVTITVFVKENIPLLDIKNVLNLTVESICNVPTMMLDMDCRICVLLPLLNSGSTSTIFYNPKITAKAPEKEVPKRWPGLHDIGYNANTTKYFIDSSFDDVKNKVNLDLQEGYKDEATRIEYNYLKRNVLFTNGNNDFTAHIIQYRKLVLEIYLTPKNKKADIRYDVYSDDQDESEQVKPKLSKTPPYLHLMAVLDVASILYPGVTKIRTACPVTTFTYEEAAKMGLENSFFLPKQIDLAASKTSKTKLNADKKKKTEKKEIKTNSKKDKGSIVKEDKNLSNLLPPKPEEVPQPEPSVPVYNEDGKPCFILAELEFLKPIYPKRSVEELKADLYQIQMEALTTEKTILNKHVASDFYRQTINEIVDDLNSNYHKYYENKTTVPRKDYGDFSGYLQKTGAYQTYLNSITTAATYIVTNKYICEEKDFKNSKTYQNLISEVFTDLISEMHSVLNTLVSTGMKPITKIYDTSGDESLFYAKETAELKLYSLADRYLLERIIYDQTNNPDFWFDYAIFNLEIGDKDKAFECAREAIVIDCDHKYALLLFGALLTEKGKTQEAETCFLNIMVQEAKWVEGWCMLFLYYQKCGRLDGMDMAFDMAQKFLEEPNISDYFSDLDNLAWSSKNVPNTIFFKTSILLLKMRLYSWVELALAQEVTIPKYYGFVNYLLAAVSYYQKNYDHAIEHIEEAKKFQGGDFAILGLSGHCLLAQGRLEEAREEYFRVIESFDRPDDIHLIYINCAGILATLGDDQMARKFILTAAKHHQTPHVWFTVGKLYFLENDVLSAEECLTEANKKDNRHAGVWGYLTLVNLKLNRPHEAEQCYQQAIRSKLDDEELNNAIKEGFKRVQN